MWNKDCEKLKSISEIWRGIEILLELGAFRGLTMK